MRRLILLILLGVAPRAFAATPACTGLCLQQVTCNPGDTTSISGMVYAPNGVDPLPNGCPHRTARTSRLWLNDS